MGMTELEIENRQLAKMLTDHFRDGVVEEVQNWGDYWGIYTEAGWGFRMSKSKYPNPRPGQRCRVYLDPGGPIRGLDLDGEEIFYQTREEYAARWKPGRPTSNFRQERLRSL
jgi:hypothetical protein